MAKLTGFMDYTRKTSTDVPPLERIENFNEFHIWLSREEQQTQAARCMDCGVPFCQACCGQTAVPGCSKFLLLLFLHCQDISLKAVDTICFCLSCSR